MTKYLSLVLTVFIFVVVDKNRYLFETTMVYEHLFPSKLLFTKLNFKL